VSAQHIVLFASIVRLGQSSDKDNMPMDTTSVEIRRHGKQLVADGYYLQKIRSVQKYFRPTSRATPTAPSKVRMSHSLEVVPALGDSSLAVSSL